MEKERTSFEQLIFHLKQLIFIYRALFTLADHKKQAIIKDDIDEVNKLTMQETKALKPVPELEAGVRQLITQLQRDLGFRPKLKMTVSELITMLVDPEQKQELTVLQNDIIAVSEKLKRANELNQQLIQQSLQYVNFSLDLLVGPEDEEFTYKRPTLQPENQRRTGIYDTRA